MKVKIKNPFAIVSTIVICIACILLALPRDVNTFNYTYEIGQPWRYEQIIAKYEFEIMKPAAQIQHEKDSVLADFAPYFNNAKGVGKQQIDNFRADYAKGEFEGVPHTYIDHTIKMLEKVYENGIIDGRGAANISKKDSASIRIINGNSATIRSTKQIRTTRAAYQDLMSAEEDVYQHDIMARLHLNNYLEPNLIYDSLRSDVARREALSTVAIYTGKVQIGERIIDRGELVTKEKHAILESLKTAHNNSNNQTTKTGLVIFGRVGLVLMFFTALLVYLHLFRIDLFENRNAIFLLFFTMTFFCVISFIFTKFQLFSVYVIPFAMAPIFIRVFMDTRTAFMAHTIMVLTASLPVNNRYQFILTQIMAGIVAIYSLRDLTERAQLFKTAAYVTLATATLALCYELSQGTALGDLNTKWYYSLAVNGILLLFAYPLLYLIERLFGFTSSVTLIELSNINTPILRRMSKEAQGTFIHSMQVGNLAAEVASKIGAKPQLVRTGALYHDIGKMINPAFFTENQSSVNPHDALTEERSAEIIISHVSEGLKLADKYFLPKVIRDFILTHHGASTVKYFYIQACNKHGEENVDKALFTYPGKNPSTREQAVLMMADAVEAASRSLKEYTEESISSLVDKIIDGQVAAGHFTECPITFRDISDAKRVFTDSLKTIYHTRIAYPDKKGEEPAPAPKHQAPAPPSRLFGSNTWTWRKN